MSCLSCPCHFKWPMDTLGIKRDPINCEKAWLDFAVRLLSREAVGKGRGQETVWGVKWKPSWWDRTVGHPWKNPTANPKDTKEVLLEKYMALESHLREEKRFPVELEEESRLWKEGKYRELFLMTSLTSLLGKVTSVHTAIEDAYVKVNELKATVHQSILTNIQNCLSSSLKRTEQLNYAKSDTNSRDKDVKTKTNKRPSVVSSLQKENTEFPPTKQKKVEYHQAQNLQKDSNFKQDHAVSSAKSDTQPSEILAFAQKLIAKRKSDPPESSVSSKNKNKINMFPSRQHREILPKNIAYGVSQSNLTPHTSLLSNDVNTAQPQVTSQYSHSTPLSNAVNISQASDLLQTPLSNAVNISQASELLQTPLNNAVNSSDLNLALFTSSKTTDNSEQNLTPQSVQQNVSFQTTPQNNVAPVCALKVIPEELDYLLSRETLMKMSRADYTPNNETPHPPLEPTQNSTLQHTSFHFDDFEAENEVTFDSATNIEEVAVPLSLGLNFEKSKTSTNVLGSTSQKEFSQTETSLISVSCLEKSVSSSPCSSDEDFDLNFFNNVDIETFCNELLRESTSSINADPAILSHKDTNPISSQNCSESVNESNDENVSLSNVNQAQPPLKEDATFVIEEIGHGKVENRTASSSNSDFGYCSEGSPPANISNTMQQDRDLESTFLLDKFFSYSENPFSFDLQ